ncbi:hypothetical protein F5148DRAFT_150886 [Russula earlei]|uniref:Uncharacterized protein n=1 Tax=Russula earlei TaxID=71964 RepID=A0ACC0U7C4_9AGAM|nr:hypothetical protein F5148DRAFT_150886 [Russula earlei]
MSPSDHSPPSPAPTPSSSPPPMSAPSTPPPAPPAPPSRLSVKRKASEEPDVPPDGIPTSSKDFEAGRVTCEACGDSVSYRDERTGAFTTKHWDAHKLGCPAPSSTTPPDRETSESLPQPSAPSAEPHSAGPPSKRRRAKRSEEERIQYLRSDPYVAKFEAYRVLCASCDKWIRLRPNSTYCSIPWDAHRKSCLARKGAKDSAPPFFVADPGARKYDGERVLCKACNSWIFVGQESQAAQAWSQHRAQCRPASPSAPSASSSAIPSVPPPPQHQLALVSSVLPPPTSRTIKEKDHPPSPLASSSPQPPSAPRLSDPPLSASAPGTGSESRRRNAEQRATQLRADPLLAQVEPHRVFCALCRKWVQLRQDSTFCAYPWQQHRSKCVIRHEKKIKTKAVESVPHSGRATSASCDESTDYCEHELGAEGDEMDTTAEDPDAVPDAGATDKRAPRYGDLDSPADRYVGLSDSILLCVTTGPSLIHISSHRAAFGQRSPSGLLSFCACRLDFTRHSIAYLFRTTYTPADALTIAALVAYLNAALPPDKHEEFDTAEVTRAAKMLHDRGSVTFEGDMLKLLR